MTKRYYVYIAASRSRVLYIGITCEIEKRMHQHQKGVYDGFTKRYKVDRLVYFERFGLIGDAIEREKQLKGWTRNRKIALIEADNSTWEDLSTEWGNPIKAASWLEELKADSSAPKNGASE